MAESAPVEIPSALANPLKDYHNNLASHLASLIRQVHISQIPAPLSGTSPEAPPNMRKDSDSSQESTSKVSSGDTTQTKESTDVTPQTSIGTKEDAFPSPKDIIISPPTDSIPISPRSINDLTARPEHNRPHFSTSFHDLDASSVGPSRGGSRSSRSLQVSPHVLPTKPSPTRSEVETREEEHRRAWETQGRKVWKHIPKTFELKLERKSRAGSASSAVPYMCTGPSGAGPGNAIRADEVFVSEAPVDMEHMSSMVPTTMESISEVSQPIPVSTPSVDASLIKTTHKGLSTLQKRQAALGDHVEAPATGKGRHSTARTQEEYEIYITRREEKFAKRANSLAHRVGIWWSLVQDNWDEACLPSTPPEIPPYLPSPGLASSQLRFLPVGSMPDLFESKGPTLRMPSITLGSRQNRLHIITDQKSESDVDLLIRLSEINQKHATASNLYSRLTPHKSISPPLSRSRDPLSDASRVHSMNVTTSMPTPKARSNSTLGTSYM